MAKKSTRSKKPKPPKLRATREYKPERTAFYLPLGVREALDRMAAKIQGASRSNLAAAMLTHCTRTMTPRQAADLISPRVSKDTDREKQFDLFA